MFKAVVDSLNKLNYKVTLERSNYVVREIDLDKLVAEISCCDDKKEKKLLQCYYNLVGVK